MSVQSILLPVFAEVGLIFVLLALMVKSRAEARKAGLAPRETALSGEAYPPKARQFANAYANQFEIPVLFFVAVVLAIVVRQAGTLFVAIEWLFVAARIAHAFVHVTSNKVTLRGPLFAVSAACTLVLWLLIASGVLVGTP
jgi:hypothetical protein